MRLFLVISQGCKVMIQQRWKHDAVPGQHAVPAAAQGRAAATGSVPSPSFPWTWFWGWRAWMREVFKMLSKRCAEKPPIAHGLLLLGTSSLSVPTIPRLGRRGGF